MLSIPINRRTVLKTLSLSTLSGLLKAQTTTRNATTPVLAADFQAAIQRIREASVRFGNGDPEPMKKAYSHAKDALMMGALGGYEQGGDEIESYTVQVPAKRCFDQLGPLGPPKRRDCH